MFECFLIFQQPVPYPFYYIKKPFSIMGLVPYSCIYPRMAAYKEYADCGCSPDYYTEKGVFYGPSFISNPFECAYGTSLKDLSTESLLLLILPCTKHVVGCDYMTYNNWSYDTNTLGIEGFIRLCNKSASGVCSNFADITQRLCDYLGIKCWYVDSCYDLFHTWAIAKVKTEAGKDVYYYIDTGIAFQIESAACLGAVQQKATRAAMGKYYPW